MGQFAALRTQKIEGFEELKEVVLGTRREIVQLERGKIKGEIAHAVIGDLPIDMASFNLGIRTKGGSHRDRIGIGLLAASANHVVRSSYEFSSRRRAGDAARLRAREQVLWRRFHDHCDGIGRRHRVIVWHGSPDVRSNLLVEKSLQG